MSNEYDIIKQENTILSLDIQSENDLLSKNHKELILEKHKKIKARAKNLVLSTVISDCFIILMTIISKIIHVIFTVLIIRVVSKKAYGIESVYLSFIHDIIGFVHQEDDESEENEYNSEDSLSSENGEKNKNYIKKNKSLDKSFDTNENYFCFILDNFNGVYMNIYDINNSYNYNEEENSKEENDLKNYSYYDQIFNLYKNYYKDLPYVPIGEENT